VCPERVLEPRVCRTRVDEVRPPELSYVSQSLKDFGVDEAESEVIDPNIVPDGVAQYLEVHGPSPRAARVILSDQRS
jgi:hypothetical protein